MRRGIALAWTLSTLVIGGIAGYIGYGVGWAQAMAARLPDGGSGAAGPYPYYYDWSWGFHPFFFVGPFLGLLFFFFVLRVVFGGFWYGRRWGGHYYGRGRHFEEWHREQHGQGVPPPPPVPPTQTV